jgi:hypothetical protein
MLRCGLCLAAAASPRLANAFMPAALNARATACYTQHRGKLIDSEYGKVPEVDSERVAVLFDFDGTIGDTETPAMEVAYWELAAYLPDGRDHVIAALHHRLHSVSTLHLLFTALQSAALCHCIFLERKVSAIALVVKIQ